jgi:predicted PurR-regulated permease PerM
MIVNLRLNYYTLAAFIFILSVFMAIYLTGAFITTLMVSLFFVYLLDPIYLGLVRLTGRKQISSSFTILVASCAILSLVYFVANLLLTEVPALISPDGVNSLQSFSISQTSTGLLGPSLSGTLATLLGSVPDTIASDMGIAAKNGISDFVSSTPLYVTQIILLVFFTYYFFIDGRDRIIRFVDIMPRRDITCYFLVELNLIYHVFFRVQFIIAVVSAILAIVGFLIIGVPYPVTWGIILGFFALLPELGPATLFVPMALYYLIHHDIARALEIFVFGEIFLVIISEFILRPRLVLRGANVHPVMTILAFTAPIFVIGPPGIIVGPIVYGFALAGYRTVLHFRKEKEDAGREDEEERINGE